MYEVDICKQFRLMLASKELYWVRCSVLLTKYYSGDQIKKNEIGGARRTYGGRRGKYRVLVGKPEGKRPLGRPSRRLEDNIKRIFRK
jgi:hypothetical protein